MKRYHEELPVMKRRMKVALRYIGADSKYAVLGRMRKKHPMDCGNARCGICKRHKVFGHQNTYQEWASELAMQEGFE